MYDENKTKAELLDELRMLRDQVAELKSLDLERTKMLDVLSKSEQGFRILLEICPIGILQGTPDRKSAYANPAMRALLEVDTHEEALASWCDFLTPESLERVMSEYTKRLVGETSSYEVEIVGKHGTKRSVIISGAPLMSAEGEFQGTIATFLDITERKKTEDALRQSQAMLQSIFRSAPVSIGLVSHRTFKWTNERLTQMTGYERTELLGRSSRMLYPTEAEYDKVGREKYEQIRINNIGIVETRWKRKDGRIIDVLLSSTPMDLDDLSVGVVFTALDITERKQAEAVRQTLQEQLQQSQKMESIGQLAGGVAHDFNNLLSIILGYSEMILRADPAKTEKRVRDRVQEIQRAGERARALTRQLLAFGRKQILEMMPIDVNEVVLGFEDMLRRLIGEHIAFVFKMGGGLRTIKADPMQLEQVLMNVCINSRDAMPDGGTLVIETANAELDEAYAKRYPDVEPGAYVVLSVSDTGCGMDEAIQQRLFEPFFTTKEKGKGSGLGLATAYGIIKQHGGHVSAYSEPGHGTTIRIYLPHAGEQPVSVASSEAAPAPVSGSGVVLVVEDDEAMRSLACSILNTYGYTVIDTGSPRQALELVAEKSNEIHLLLSDVVMPEMNGRQLYEKAAAISPALRVLYMSGHTETAIAQHGVLEDGMNFIQKPFTVSELLQRVQSVLNS